MLGLSMPPAEDGDDEDFLDDKSDLLLAEYERLKREEEGHVTGTTLKEIVKRSGPTGR